MINANELRIGNWIMCDEGQSEHLVGRIVKVTSLSEKVAHWEQSPTFTGFGKMLSGTHYEDCEPILLTQEIIDKCKLPTGNLICPFINKVGYDLLISECGGFAGVPIFYLHQLQNLYHALTGEELTIQL